MNEQIKSIINKAVWAPSGDNSQPWRFEVKDNTVLVYNLPERDNPILNFRQSGSYIAHGALLENIQITASHYRLEGNINLFPSVEDASLVAEINFTTNPLIVPDPLMEYIEKRHTNRRPYKDRALSREQIELLTKAVGDANKGTLILLDTPEPKFKAAKSAAEIEKIALEHQKLHSLFFGDIFWSTEKNIQGSPGLYIKTLELPWPVERLFKLLRSWRITQILNKIGFSNLASTGNARIYSKSGAVGALVTNSSSSFDYIKAGRMMQRAWLTVTKLGLSMQPITGLPFLAQRIQAGEAKDFSDEHIKKAMEAYNNLLKTFNIKDKTIAVIFRIGYANMPTARSGRMEPSIVWK